MSEKAPKSPFAQQLEDFDKEQEQAWIDDITTHREGEENVAAGTPQHRKQLEEADAYYQHMEKFANFTPEEVENRRKEAEEGLSRGEASDEAYERNYNHFEPLEDPVAGTPEYAEKMEAQAKADEEEERIATRDAKIASDPRLRRIKAVAEEVAALRNSEVEHDDDDVKLARREDALEELLANYEASDDYDAEIGEYFLQKSTTDTEAVKVVKESAAKEESDETPSSDDTAETASKGESLTETAEDKEGDEPASKEENKYELKPGEKWEVIFYDKAGDFVNMKVDEDGEAILDEDGNPTTKPLEEGDFYPGHEDDRDETDEEPDDEPSEDRTRREKVAGPGSWWRAPLERLRALGTPKEKEEIEKDPDARKSRKWAKIAIGAAALAGAAALIRYGILIGEAQDAAGATGNTPGMGGAGNVPHGQGSGINQVANNANEFSAAARTVEEGEGFRQLFKDMNIPKEEWSGLLEKVASSTNKDVQEWVMTLPDGTPGISHSGQMPESVLESIQNLR